MQSGYCLLCGEYCNLTFEHVPPRIAFNKITKYQTVQYLDLLRQKDPLNSQIKGKIEQGGVGFYSLCSTCNSFLGTEYVTAYTQYSNSFIALARKLPSNHFVIEMHDFEALRVLKQIVSMFLSINSLEFSQKNPELAEFVLNPTKTQLPKRFRFFEYLNSEGQLRNIPLSITGNFQTGISIAASEIAFPPLGHVMTIDFRGELAFHQEITDFSNHSIDQKVSLKFDIYRLPTVLPMLLDYRTKEAIEETIRSNS